jgi:hypothetical protein
MELKGAESSNGLVFAAGVSSEGEDEEDMEIRRYAIALLQEFFKKRGRHIEIDDYRLMLKRIFRHIHQHIISEWEEQDRGLDLALVVADTSKAYAARSGGGDMFLFHEDEARSLFAQGGKPTAPLGTGTEEEMQLEETPLQPGDILVLVNPAMAGVIRMRDVTLILRRAADPPKAGLFLSAIAERKGAEGPLTALVWEVPNYQGAAMLTEEPPTEREGEPEKAEEEEVGPDEVEGADHAKKRWLSQWRRRRKT